MVRLSASFDEELSPALRKFVRRRRYQMHLATEDGRQRIVVALSCIRESVFPIEIAEKIVEYLIYAEREDVGPPTAEDSSAGLNTLAARGDLRAVRRLLESPPLCHHAGWAAGTACVQAAKSNQAHVLRYLMECSGVAGNQIFSPLHVAAARNHADLVRYLVEEAGEPVDLLGKDNRTPLHVASRYDSVAAGSLLVQLRARVDARDGKGTTPLQVALANMREGMMRCLAEGGASLTIPDRTGRLPLHTAALYKLVDAARCFVMADSGDIPPARRRCVRHGKTPLHYAGSAEMVAFLVEEASAELEAEDAQGATPLMAAVLDGRRVAVLERLIWVRADVNARMPSGRTPLHMAASTGRVDVARALTDGWLVRVDALDRDGATALHVAARCGSGDVARYLVEEAGADVDAMDGRGRTPLRVAAEHECAEVCEYLLSAGAKALT